MRMLIDLIYNRGIYYDGQEYYYENFHMQEIHDFFSNKPLPDTIFIVNGPFFISGYRKALMLSKAIQFVKPVEIYGFDLLRDYAKSKDSITINNRTFVKDNNNFYIQKEEIKSSTNYSLSAISKKMSSLALMHNNIFLDWK